jgi:hypothetical protein
MSDRCIVLQSGKPAFLAISHPGGLTSLVDIGLIATICRFDDTTRIWLKNGTEIGTSDTPESILLRLKKAGYDIVA